MRAVTGIIILMLGFAVGIGVGASITIMRIYDVVMALINGTATTWYVFVMSAESGLAIIGGKLIATTFAAFGEGLVDNGKRDVEGDTRK